MKILLNGHGGFDVWRDAARDLLRHGIAPHCVDWGMGLDAAVTPVTGALDRSLTMPEAFLDLAEAMIRHGDPAAFALAYRLLWRLQREHNLLDSASDPDVICGRQMARAAYRERRARVAWIAPERPIVARAVLSRKAAWPEAKGESYFYSVEA